MFPCSSLRVLFWSTQSFIAIGYNYVHCTRPCELTFAMLASLFRSLESLFPSLAFLILCSLSGFPRTWRPRARRWPRRMQPKPSNVPAPPCIEPHMHVPGSCCIEPHVTGSPLGRGHDMALSQMYSVCINVVCIGIEKCLCLQGNRSL